AGVYYGPSLYSRFAGPSAPLTDVKPAPASKASKPAGPDATEAVKPPATTVAETTHAPATAPASNPTSAPSATPSGTGARGATDTRPTHETPSTTAPPSEPAPSPTVAGVPETAGAADQPFPDLHGAEYAWATTDQLELIWRGSQVPLDALHAPVKTLMPKI